MKLLDGYKTYIGCIACGFIGIAMAQGWISNETGGTLLAVVASLTGVSMRKGIKKSGPNGGNT